MWRTDPSFVLGKRLQTSLESVLTEEMAVARNRSTVSSLGLIFLLRVLLVLVMYSDSS